MLLRIRDEHVNHYIAVEGLPSCSTFPRNLIPLISAGVGKPPSLKLGRSKHSFRNRCWISGCLAKSVLGVPQSMFFTLASASSNLQCPRKQASSSISTRQKDVDKLVSQNPLVSCFRYQRCEEHVASCGFLGRHSWFCVIECICDYLVNELVHNFTRSSECESV